MRCVLATEATVLAEFEPLRRLLLVFRRAVIPALARAARQLDDVSHLCNLAVVSYQSSESAKLVRTVLTTDN
jgi:hypothetical protein